MPAMAFFLVNVDEVGNDVSLVRGCDASPTDTRLKNFNLTPLQAIRLPNCCCAGLEARPGDG